MVLLLVATTIHAADTLGVRQPDFFLLTSSIPFDYRTGALANAGCALLTGPRGALNNPAIPNPSAGTSDTQVGSFSAGYGRDSLIPRHVIPVSGSWSHKEGGTTTLLMRYLDAEENRLIHQGMINYSTRLFDKSVNQGAVDYGITLRAERVAWETRDLPLLQSRTFRRVELTDSVVITPTGITDSLLTGKYRAYHFGVDLGFFQPHISENVDFGLTLHNVIGYTWLWRRPTVVTTRTIHKDTTIIRERDTTTVDQEWVDSSRYHSEYVYSQGWIDGKYRAITTGIVFHVPEFGEGIQVSVPLDLHVSGLMGGSKTRFSFRAGVETHIGENWTLRAGYARAPRLLSEGDLVSARNLNVNTITAGGGVRLGPITADMYVSKDSWGLSGAIRM